MCALLARFPLGPRPWLHRLRCRFPGPSSSQLPASCGAPTALAEPVVDPPLVLFPNISERSTGSRPQFCRPPHLAPPADIVMILSGPQAQRDETFTRRMSAMPMGRRQFLLGSALPALAGAVSAHAAGSVEDAVQDRTVQFRSDGLVLSSADYARLLARLAENSGIEVDEYSRHGVVGLLEERMAAILGKEMAIYLPTGTRQPLGGALACGDRRRVLVQQESHLYNDAGDCAQQLSGLALVPLASGQASFTLSQVSSEIQRAESGRVRSEFGVISIESPVRRAFGEVFNFSEMQKIADFAREREIGLHLNAPDCFSRRLIRGCRPQPIRPSSTPSMYRYTSASIRPPARSSPDRES